jgi:hypothetical protein
VHLSRRLIAHIGLLLGLALVVGACNGDDPDQATDGTTTTEVDLSTTTTATTQPTTSTRRIEGPAPWTNVIRNLYARLGEINASPDPNLVASVISEECDCFEPVFQSVEQLAARGERIVGIPPTPVAVQTEGRTDLPLQRLTVKLEVGPSQLVDEAGNVIEEIPAAGTQCASVLVMPTGPGNAYRIHDLFQVQRCPEGL